jgi:uncharacterized protein with HEPN domain
MKDDSPYIAQMLENISKIERFIGGVTFEAFEKDEQKQGAILMQLQQIGEMAKRVSVATQQGIDIPWAKIVGFRNIVAHEYYDIVLSLVWNTIVSDLPALKVSLAQYLTAHPLPPEPKS